MKVLAFGNFCSVQRTYVRCHFGEVGKSYEWAHRPRDDCVQGQRCTKNYGRAPSITEALGLFIRSRQSQYVTILAKYRFSSLGNAIIRLL